MQAAAAWCNDGPLQHVQLRRWFSGSLDVGLVIDLEAEQRGAAIAARMFARFKDRTTTDVNKALNDIMAGRTRASMNTKKLRGKAIVGFGELLGSMNVIVEP